MEIDDIDRKILSVLMLRRIWAFTLKKVLITKMSSKVYEIFQKWSVLTIQREPTVFLPELSVEILNIY